MAVLSSDIMLDRLFQDMLDVDYLMETDVTT